MLGIGQNGTETATSLPQTGTELTGENVVLVCEALRIASASLDDAAKNQERLTPGARYIEHTRIMAERMGDLLERLSDAN